VQLSVGTNWDPAVPAACAGTAVGDFFASARRTAIGSGRPAENLPDPDRAAMEQHIREVHRAGCTFSYLLNPPWADGLEFDPAVRMALVEELEWLRANGVDYVVVAIPYLMEFVRTHFPNFKIKASYSNRVVTVEHARRLVELGAEVVCLHQSVMRDFPLLNAVREALPDTRLQLIVDVSCLPQCPSSWSFHHASACSALSRLHAPASEHGYHSVTYGMAWCHSTRLAHPVDLLKGGFIRPEEVGLYEEVGIDSLKLASRPLTTEAIFRKVRAYLARRWEGNLLDIINLVSFGLPDSMLGRTDEGGAAARAYAEIKNRFDFGRMVRIDNRALDGFLELFRKRPCPPSCGPCDWCDRFANQAISLAPEMVEAFRTLLDEQRAELCGPCRGA
jgi:collagenase-like PrtC family protease